jgi:excisionase family DNA binding protein
MDEDILRLLTITELARATAESQAVWRKRIQRREIEFLKCGRNVRVTRTALQSWLNARRKAIESR